VSLQLLNSVGLQGPYESLGSFPQDDHCGYEVVNLMLLASQRPGRYACSHTKFGHNL
jgi:hypothetical protein